MVWQDPAEILFDTLATRQRRAEGPRTMRKFFSAAIVAAAMGVAAPAGANDGPEHAGLVFDIDAAKVRAALAQQQAHQVDATQRQYRRGGLSKRERTAFLKSLAGLRGQAPEADPELRYTGDFPGSPDVMAVPFLRVGELAPPNLAPVPEEYGSWYRGDPRFHYYRSDGYVIYGIDRATDTVVWRYVMDF